MSTESKRIYDRTRYLRKSAHRIRRNSPEWKQMMAERGIRLRKQEGWSAFTQLFNSYRRNSRLKGFVLEITKEQAFALMQLPCHYCGAAPAQIFAPKRFWTEFVYNGLDRVENSLGYSMANVVPCCKICNWAKRDLSAQEFLEWVARISNFQQQKK